MPAFFSSWDIVRDGRCSFAGELSAPPQNCVWIPGAQDRFKLGDPLNSLRRWGIFGGCLGTSVGNREIIGGCLGASVVIWEIFGEYLWISLYDPRSDHDRLNQRDPKAVPTREGGSSGAGRGLVNQNQAAIFNVDRLKNLYPRNIILYYPCSLEASRLI